MKKHWFTLKQIQLLAIRKQNSLFSNWLRFLPIKNLFEIMVERYFPSKKKKPPHISNQNEISFSARINYCLFKFFSSFGCKFWEFTSFFFSSLRPSIFSMDFPFFLDGFQKSILVTMKYRLRTGRLKAAKSFIYDKRENNFPGTCTNIIKLKLRSAEWNLKYDKTLVVST